MDFGVRFFWGLVTALLVAAAVLGVGAEQRRQELLRGSEATLTTGELVRLVRVIDGDTVVVARDDGGTVAVRMLGIKAFPATSERDATQRIAVDAVATLSRMCEGQPLRVLLHSTPRDQHGRVLAELFVGDTNVAVALIQEGLVLVYTVYPFASMSLYLEEQEAARAERRGLWRQPAAVQRAEQLAREWARERR